MIPDLTVRDAHATELMDDPDCDRVLLARTYAQFPLVNAVVGGWRGVYRREIRPRARHAPLRVLDVGCGGGDVARAIARWARRDRLPIGIVAIDPDPRAISWARRQRPMAALTLRAVHSAALVEERERFDVVISNHLLHHLAADQLAALLEDSRRLLAPGGIVLHRDIRRGRFAYFAFAVATAPFPRMHRGRSFIRADGLTSIRRSYTNRELSDAVPAGWAVRAAFPARLELRREDDRDRRLRDRA